MREIIKEIYQSMIDGDIEPYAEIATGVERGDIELLLEDIVPLCKVFTYNFEFMEFCQTVEIPDMIYEIIDNNAQKEGLKELIKGLEEIYRNGPRGRELDLNYDDYLETFLGIFMVNYEENDMIFFGQLISESKDRDFKCEILKQINICINKEENQDLKSKGKLFMDNIAIEQVFK